MSQSKNKYAVSDHAEAAAEMLEQISKSLRSGVSPEDLGHTVILIGRIMARKI